MAFGFFPGQTEAIIEKLKQVKQGLLHDLLTRGIVARAAQIYAERFGEPDGRIPATFEIIHLAGWAPHESQQKPLPRGSAKMRLADALGVREQTGEG